MKNTDKDIDALLKQKAPKPQRPLKKNFARSVMVEIKAGNQRPGKWQTFLEPLRRSLVAKIGLASMVAILLAGGTAAALILWPAPQTSKITSQPLPSGARIVGINATDCNYMGDLYAGPWQPSDQNLYFEVRKGSKLSDAQIVSSLQGICEENVANTAVFSVISKLPRDQLSTVLTTENLTVKAIDPSTITVASDPHYTDPPTKQNVTLTRFSTNLLVYDKTSPLNYSQLHVGDSVKLALNIRDAKAPKPNSDNQLSNQNPIYDTGNIRVLAIVRVPSLTTDPNALKGAFAKDVVRVEPCPNGDSGFCQTNDFELQ